MPFKLSDEKADMLSEALDRGTLEGDRADVAREALRRSGRDKGQPGQDVRPTMEQIKQHGRQQGQEMDDSAAFVAALGEGIFGLGPRVRAAYDTFTGDDDGPTYEENLAFRRSEVEGAIEDAPVSGGLGYLTGMIGGGGGVGGLAARGAAKVAPRAAAAMTPRAGQGVRNVGRYAAGGTAGGGAQAAGEGDIAEDTAGGAILGAVGGPIAAGVLRVGRIVGGRALQMLGNRSAANRAALRRVADDLRQPGETGRQATERLEGDRAAFRKAFGREPAINELVDDAVPSPTRKAVETDPQAARTARDTAQRVEQDIPAQLTERSARGDGGVLQSRVSPTPERTQATAEREYGRFVEQHGDVPVPPTEEFAELASRPDFARAVYRNATDDVANDVRNMIQNGTPVPLRSLDNARKRIGDSLSKMDPFDRNYTSLREAREAVTAHISATRPEYGDMLKRWGYRMDIQKGIEHGRKVFSRSDPASFRDAYAAADAATQRGMRWGTRSAIRTMAGESPKDARSALQNLAENEGVHRRLGAMLPEQEVQDIVQAAEIGNRAFKARQASTPREVVTVNKAMEMFRTGVEGGLIGVGRASGAFAASAIMRTLGRVGVSRAEARRLAEMVYDPEQAPVVFEELARRGIEPEQFRKTLNSAVVSGQGLGAGATE